MSNLPFIRKKVIHFILTGHSRGAVQAAINSERNELPAFVFENPGVSSDLGYQFDNVVSFQSIPNVVNHLDASGRSYTYGLVVPLTPTVGDQLIHNGLQVLSHAINTPLGSVTALGAQTYYSHSTQFLEPRLETTLGEIPQPSLFFKPNVPPAPNQSPFLNRSGKPQTLLYDNIKLVG